MPGERYAVIGAGIIGLATAREITRRHPDAVVTVVDKEPEVAAHQSSHNSGVVHAGLYYQPGSLKAQLCHRGRALMRDLCAERGLAFEPCGKLVVARSEAEVPALRAIEASARANRVPALAWLDRSGLRQIEPHAEGVAALHSPHTAIVDYAEVARALAGELDVRLGFEVVSVSRHGTDLVISDRQGQTVVADRLVICAGLQSDRVARLGGDQEGPGIVAFRGEYWRLRPERAYLAKGLIYPVPDPRYPFLGVHFTRRIGGAVDIGPNAVLALARQGYRRRQVDPTEVAYLIGSTGFRRLARRHWRAGLREMIGSWSKMAFLAAAASLVPEVKSDDVVRAPSGVRAQAVDPDGTLVDDFRIRRTGPGGRIFSVRNAPSPAATASLAIAEYVVAQMD